MVGHSIYPTDSVA